MKPDGRKVADCLVISSGSDDSFVHEERVGDFLKRFVGGLNSKQAGIFLKFVTSREVFTQNTVITVQFNGTTDQEQMTPTANTCGNICLLYTSPSPRDS